MCYIFAKLFLFSVWFSCNWKHPAYNNSKANLELATMSKKYTKNMSKMGIGGAESHHENAYTS